MLATNSYKSKKELKAAVGTPLLAEETSVFGPECSDNCTVCVGGYKKIVMGSPYFVWYASVTVKNGLIAKVS